MIDTQQGIENQ